MSDVTNDIFDAELVAEHFPILQQTVHEQPLVFLDSAASSQKPQAVIDVISHYYANDNANVHRGVYELSQRATAAYEATRQAVRHFINAPKNEEIIFTKGTTESINLIAASFGQSFQADDEIILSAMEHHSNIVPWQLLCERTGAKIKVIRLHQDGTLDLDHYRELLSDKTKIVSIIHASNVLGTINPVKEIIELAHQHDIPVLLDAAQSVPHMPVDVQDLDCDFLVFSSHKLYGPTGVGVLYGKTQFLEAMPPYQGGGDMIRSVTFEKTDYNVLPYKFEAGTLNIAGVIGLGAAIEYLNKMGMQAVANHEAELLQYANQKLMEIPGLKIIGQAPKKVGVISFVMDVAHPHDIGTILDHEGVAIRVGHHCAMPLMDYYGLPATARASFGIYNTKRDVNRLVSALHKVRDVFDV